MDFPRGGGCPLLGITFLPGRFSLDFFLPGIIAFKETLDVPVITATFQFLHVHDCVVAGKRKLDGTGIGA